MAAKLGESGRNAELHRATALLNELMDGKVHDRHSVSARWRISLPTADRDLKAIAKVRGVVKERQGKRSVYRFEPTMIHAALRHSSVIAACFGASLSSLFEGSVYGRNLHEARDFLVKHARRRKDFCNVDRKFVFVRRGGEGSLPDRAGELDDLLEAILGCKWVTIDYLRFDGEKKAIRIAPLSMAIYDHQLYVIARSEKQPWTAYRFCRIEKVEVEDKTFDYPSIEEYDPIKIFSERFGIFMSDNHDVEDIEVWLAERWKTYAKTHRWHPSQRTIETRDGVVVKLRVRACPEVEAWVLSFGEDAQVLAPVSLQERVLLRIEKMVK
ncbi:WYL domain-containing protein [Polyangium sp. y55x31]|uniref:helix-turn-helix transcriptional regulator n=1 Tax=Polyangium sp. y55x31 TaxID=3042688 RepID=UPI0024822FD2|nr:WYL domain-containing protein [Polyangium sp. y55x31]MDI1477173.1 WYL domain-containing protein [Polyangium sp. y55x31]